MKLTVTRDTRAITAKVTCPGVYFGPDRCQPFADVTLSTSGMTQAEGMAAEKNAGDLALDAALKHAQALALAYPPAGRIQ